MGNGMKRKTRNWVVLCILLLIALIFCVRIIHLDQDPPAWGVGFYQPVDEGAYAFMAINEKAYGTIRPLEEDSGGFQTLITGNFIMNILGNLLNIAGFKLWGNNYYGLRLPYVFISLLNLLLFGIMLNQLRRRYGDGKDRSLWAMLALLVWMVVDFSFFLAGRIVEPTSIRLLFVQLCAVVYLGMPSSQKLRYFILGILITFSVFLVYITNIFMYLAVAATLLFVLTKDGKAAFFRGLIWFAAGCIVCLVATEAYYFSVWETEAVLNALQTVSSFSQAELYAYSDYSFFRTMAQVYLRIFSANPMVYNLPMVVASFFALPILVHIIHKKKDEKLFFLLMVVLSFFLQSCFSYDTLTRKMIVVFPIFVGLLYVAYLLRDKRESIRASVPALTIGEKTISPNTLRIIAYVLLWGIGTGTAVFSFVYRAFRYNLSYADFDFISKLALLVLQVIPIVCVAIAKVIHFCRQESKRATPEKMRLWKEKSKKLDRVAMPAVFLLMCLCNVFYAYHHAWSNPLYGERDAMIAMADEVDGKYVFGGGFPLGFTLYNNMRPIVHYPETIVQYAGRSEDALLLEYTNENFELSSYFESVYYPYATVRFIPYHTIRRDFQTFGDARNMTLYRFAATDTYYAYLREKEATTLEAYNASRAALSIAVNSEFQDRKDDFDYAQEQYLLYRYPAITTPLHVRSQSEAMFLDVYSDVLGDINFDLYGNVYGSIYGDVNATIHGTVHGKVHGTIRGAVTGGVLGEMD